MSLAPDTYASIRSAYFEVIPGGNREPLLRIGVDGLRNTHNVQVLFLRLFYFKPLSDVTPGNSAQIRQTKTYLSGRYLFLATAHLQIYKFHL